jgi:hypothetical protein
MKASRTASQYDEDYDTTQELEKFRRPAGA